MSENKTHDKERKLRFFWCERHKRAEQEGTDTRECLLVGPFSSKEQAEEWNAYPRPAPSPLGELADILAEYDRIVDARLDQRDAEADFVMRGSDWRAIREALSARGDSVVLQAKIEEFSALKADWDSYGAEAFDPRTIDLALEIARKLGPEWKCVPCADGPSVWLYRGDGEDILEVRTSYVGEKK